MSPLLVYCFCSFWEEMSYFVGNALVPATFVSGPKLFFLWKIYLSCSVVVLCTFSKWSSCDVDIYYRPYKATRITKVKLNVVVRSKNTSLVEKAEIYYTIDNNKNKYKVVRCVLVFCEVLIINGGSSKCIYSSGQRHINQTLLLDSLVLLDGLSDYAS